MFSVDPGPKGSRRSPRMAAIGPIVLAVVFLIALVLAANNNTVLGWFIAVVALGWLILATAAYIGVSKVARFSAEQIRRLQGEAGTEEPRQSGRSGSAGTQLIDESQPSDGIRDMKLDHSFAIIHVQARVIAEELKKANDKTGNDKTGKNENIDRALETITITAHNGQDLLAGSTQPRGNQPPGNQPDRNQPGQKQDKAQYNGEGDEGGPLSGTVLPG